MNPISTPVERIGASYTVVIVGSGYGGAVLASRLARAGCDVALLERGREFVPGQFPRTTPAAAREFTVQSPDLHLGRKDGLYWAHLGPEISVVSGSGLGGTSLINANVSLRPDARVFRDGRWPAEIAEDAGAMLNEGYERARSWLDPNPYPESAPRLPKMEAHRKSAAAIGQPFTVVPINVAFEDRLSASGVPQAACTLCGDCVSGCNYGSKNTLRMNYLPDAWAHGATIFCGVEVQRVERRGERWLVHYQLLGVGRERLDAPDSFVSADLVVLAAGTLGSTEILLRSREAGLPVSNMLGHHFTGNADALGFAFATGERIDGAGLGTLTPGDVGPVGPCITSMVDARMDGDCSFDEMILEEGNLPGPIAEATITMLELAAPLEGERTTHGLGARLRELAGEVDTAIRGPHHGVGSHTQVYLGIGMDDGEGRISLENNRVAMSWPGVGTQPMFETIAARMREATRALEGVFVRNPAWTAALGHRLVTVHPLGGCPMGDSADRGVVNHRHLVYDGMDATSVHQGLYVADGSVVPSPLSVNPLLTITALAERCAMYIAADRGLSFDITRRVDRLPEPPPATVGVRFSETMHGWYGEGPDFESGARAGEAAGTSLRFVLTMSTDDLEAVLKDPSRPYAMTGTVVAPGLSEAPLTVAGGEFKLFTPDPARPGARQMRYRVPARTVDGRLYTVIGRKDLHDDPGLDLWRDATTLFTTIHDGPDEQSPVLGRGVLRLTVEDLMTQLTTIAATHASDEVVALEAVARFGAAFFRDLWRLYRPTLRG